MLRAAAIFVILGLSACRHVAAAEGPSPDELRTAMLANSDVASGQQFQEVSNVHCRAFDEEPTEFLCKFRGRTTAGVWKGKSAILAVDGGRWILLSLD